MDLPHTLEEDRPPQVGVIVLSEDESLEPDFRRLLPPPIELLVTRVPSGRHVRPDTLAAMDGALGEAAGRFPSSARLGSVGYGCTSATAEIGAPRVHGRITSGLGAPVPVSEPVSACLAATAALGVTRLALVSPYIEAVSERLMSAFVDGGLEIVRFGSFNVSEEARVARITAASIEAAATELGRDPDCEAVFLSCTNLRTLDVIEPIEEALGKPVLSSNQVLAWHMARQAGVAELARIPGALGRL